MKTQPNDEAEERDFVLIDAPFSPAIVALTRLAVQKFVAAAGEAADITTFEPVEWAVWSEVGAPVDVVVYRVAGCSTSESKRRSLVVEFGQVVDSTPWEEARRDGGIAVSVYELAPTADDAAARLSQAIVSASPSDALYSATVELAAGTPEPQAATPGPRSGQIEIPVLEGRSRLFEILALPGPAEFEFRGLRRPAKWCSAKPQAIECLRVMDSGAHEPVGTTLDAVAADLLGTADALVYSPAPRVPQENRDASWLAFVISSRWTGRQARQFIENHVGVLERFPGPFLEAEYKVAADAWVFALVAPSLD